MRTNNNNKLCFRFRQIIISLNLLIVSLNLSAQDPNFHIYLCFGQSNMSGNGEIEAQDLVTNDRFNILRAATCNSNGYNYTAGEWETALSPLNRCDTKLTFVDNFGKTLANNLPDQITIGVSIVAVGGSEIALFDKDNYASYVATAPSWMQSQINYFGGNPYGRLIEMGMLAKQVGVIKGILLHQGESNTGQTDWPNKVKAIYDNIIADLELDPTQTPLLVGEMLRADQGGVCSSHNTIIANVPNVIPNSYVISSEGLPGYDQFHFDSEGCRTLGERYANKMLELLPTIDPNFPEITITTPSASSVFTAPATIEIAATASDPNGTITKVEFYNGNTILEEDSSSPYSYSWTNVDAGTYIINAVATDNDGNTTTTSVTINVNVPQTAYGGTPHVIPGKIEFEDYDVCGNGCAYYDDSPGTSVPSPPDYRPGEDVDIEVCTDIDGGYNIGYGKAGEWLEYTVDIAATGIYDIGFRVACDGDERTISLSYEDGTSIANDITIPNTGGWQTWQDVIINDIELQAGEQVLRLTIGAENYINLNYMTFSSDSLPIVLPSISIMSPTNSDEFNANETITISAIASASDATVVNVEFYANNQLLNIDSTAPYTFDWSGMAVGNYLLRAVVIDSNNNEASDEVSLSVIASPLAVELRAGWNFIGCPISGNTAIETALSSILSEVETVKDFNGFWDVNNDPILNSLNSLDWGKGYFIKVESNCQLTW